ncbi:MAG TPA: glycerate kinase, partial [Mycobacteriales bacterium]|nr:glycerate kinase [Mycobacteriales bacterium]
MRVVVAVDSFGDTMTAPEAARAVADGWHSVAPRDELDLAPVSDGGPGFVDVLSSSARSGPETQLRPAAGGGLLSRTVRGPHGRDVVATVLLRERTAYVETAQAIGLHLLSEAERDPRRTTSFGAGQL